MEQRISLITLGVADLAKAKAFYDALGWQVTSDNATPEIVAYDLLSMTLALYPTAKLAEDAGISNIHSGYSAFAIAYNVHAQADVDQTLQHAEKAGGEIIKPAYKASWGGYSGCFCDIDRHIWEVAYNPFSKLGPRGEFRWSGY